MAIFIVQFLCLPILIIIYAFFSLRVFSFKKTLMKNVFDMLSGILNVFYGHVSFCLKIEYLTSLNNDLKSSYQPTTSNKSNTSRLGFNYYYVMFHDAQ